MNTKPRQSTATLEVTGMTCDHCVASVKKEIGALTGVNEVTVELVPGGISTVTVTGAYPRDADQLAAAIDEAGYELAAPR